MLNRPVFDSAVTRRAIWDITEKRPIPRGSLVQWADYDGCADLYYVEYVGRIYAALPDELVLPLSGTNDLREIL